MNRIVTRLTLAASLGIATVMAAHAWLRVDREREVLDNDVRRDHATLGQALAETVGAILELGTPEDALVTLEEMNQRRGHVAIRWVDGPPSAPGSRVVERPGGRALLTQVVVETSAGAMGHLELVEELTTVDEFLRATLGRVAVTALVSILVCALFVQLAGRWTVARPLARIVGKIRRVAEGELAEPIEVTGADELSAVARELNQMSARLADARETAERAAEARVAAVEQLRHADRLSTVGTLAAGVAHELGTPLNVISARAKMIERGESEGDEIPGDARVIRQQSENVARIVRQLLDFARARSAAREVVDVREVAASVLEMLRPHARGPGVELRVAEGERVAAAVDHGMMTQVITNLVMNAIQAQPGGGEVDVTVDATDAELTLVVEDRGPGVPEELRERVFEPFFTTKDVGAGTGLGLSVVLGMVREHGGRVAVEARDGGGARFRVTLPRGEAA